MAIEYIKIEAAKSKKKILVVKPCSGPWVSAAKMAKAIIKGVDIKPSIEPNKLIYFMRWESRNKVVITIQKGINEIPAPTHAMINKIRGMVFGAPFTVFVVPKWLI